MPIKSDQKILRQLEKMETSARNNVLMNTTVADTVSKILNSVEDDDIKLNVNKVWIEKKHDNRNIQDQQDVRNKGQVWSNELRADLSLVDKESNKVVDHITNIKVATIPKLTDRNTYLIKGNEYQFTKQSRLKPGVYTKEQTNGEISSFFNVDKTIDFDRGFNNNFKINFEPERKRFIMQYGSKRVPLINALKAVGVTKKELVEKWGQDVYDANAKAFDKHENRDQQKLYNAIFGFLPGSDLTDDQVRTEIKDRLFATKLDPDTTKITLGKAYKNVGKAPILDASKKIIDIHRGDVEGDDRESLIFKSFYDVEDHIREKLVKNSNKIMFNMKYKLKKNKAINKSLSSQSFDPFIVGTLTNSQLSNPPTQTNPMSIIGETSKMTVMGEGGIGTTNAITNDVREISNSEAGFIDPLHTPEGGSIGVAVHHTAGTIKVGNDIYSKFINKKGEKMLLRPVDVYDRNISFPDQFIETDKGLKPKSAKVKVIRRGKLAEIAANKVDAVINSSVNMFDTSANSIPFLDSIQGNRGLTASKMQEQALSLTNRDKPMFNIVDKSGTSIGETLGTLIAIPKSSINGEVVDITDNEIVVADKKGKKHISQLYNNFSLNSESFLHNRPIVKIGDSVKKDQILADNNYTRDGQMSLGANLRVAYLPYKGYNFEDSAIMSESGAKKLTSQHIYDHKAKRSANGVFSKSKYKAYYPEELNAKQAAKLDKEGVAKIGQVLERDDTVVAYMEQKAPTADDLAVGRLDKQLRRDMANDAIKWDNDVPGVVTGVKKHGNSVIVSVKAEEPLKVADKISGLHGNKHIISKIIPDEEMPFNPVTGKYIDLTMSPIGVSNRINTSQLLENAAGKIAEKTGEQFKIHNFSGKDNTAYILNELKKVGLSDKDILVDPETRKPFINPVANGISHILKLEHKVDHKYSARYRDGYDSNEQAATGGKTGGKNIGRMEMAALLARGANENLREMFNIKGQENTEYWKAMETGQSLPPPKKAFVWDKMLSMMAGAGIDVEQKGKTFTLKPMTDDEIVKKSAGELKRPHETYRKKDLMPMREGLFDPIKAGGMYGEHYTHFKLPEKILNPITASATGVLIDKTSTELDNIINGRSFINKTTGKTVEPGSLNAISGGPAIENLLSRVSVDEDLKQAKMIAENSNNSTVIEKMRRKIKYLRSFKEKGMKPTDYMIENVLVTPSKYRPMFTMGTEKTVIMSDINELYQQTAHSAQAFRAAKKDLDENVKNEDIKNLTLAEIRGQIYQDAKAVAGLQEPTSYLHRVKNKKGYITQIDGGQKKQTKEGFFQDKVMERRQDLVGRSTIILNPDLGGDNIGIPKTMATEIFRPFIMSKLVSWGYPPLEAQKQIKDKTKVFERARQVVTDDRLVIANRAPTLHRWNMTAFKPKLTDGKSVEVPAVVVTKNFSGDYDGDAFTIHTPVSQAALKEAEKMKPSASMLKTGYDTVLNAPSMDAIVGSWLVSKGMGGNTISKKFKNVDEAKYAFDNHNIKYSDMVTINSRKAPFGMHAINSVVPEDSKRWDVELDKDNVDDWIHDVTKKHNGKLALNLADKVKEIGNNYSTTFGFTLGVSDTVVDKDIRDKAISQAKKKSKSGSPDSIIKAYYNERESAQKALEKKHGIKTMLGIGIKSGGSKGIGNTAAITLMPGIVTDASDRPIPIPITKSYSEGLDTFGYWTAAQGARGGNIKKSVSSFKPGWLTKDLMNSIYDTKIYTDDPTDTEGLEQDISNRKAITNRYLAQDVKNTKGKIIAKRNDLIDSDVVNKLNQRGIKKVFVQSPITDPTPGDGFSGYSYGLDYDGKRPQRGDNIGVISAHTITEPSLNLAMKAFHTGGAMEAGEKGKGTLFDRLWDTVHFTKNVPDKATMSSMNGVVSNVNKSSVGGWDVVLSDGKNEEVRYIDPRNKLIVNQGQSIKAGDMLSTGTPSVHDVLKYKGMRQAQKFLVGEIDKINDGKLDSRDIETIVRGISNTTRVTDPGSSTYVKGDVAPLTTIDYYNKNNLKEEDVSDTEGDHLAQGYDKYNSGIKITKNMMNDFAKQGLKRIKVRKDKIKHDPFLTPAGIAAKAASSEDWIARLAHNRVRKVLQEGTTQGWKSTLDPIKGHPISNYVAGGYSW